MDTAARFGGDEFAIVLPETGVESANVVARRIRQSLARDDKKPNLSVSIGVAVYPRDGTSIETILSAADKALYLRKSRAHSRERKASGTSGSIRVKAAAG
jgi:diguanylate cyclase (GGDEF)-like protein